MGKKYVGTGLYLAAMKRAEKLLPPTKNYHLYTYRLGYAAGLKNAREGNTGVVVGTREW